MKTGVLPANVGADRGTAVPRAATSSNPGGRRSEIGSHIEKHIFMRARRETGFTLMELLVSMTLMGFLAVAIHYGFRVGTSAWEKGDRQLERIRKAQATFDLLSRQLGSMVPYYSHQKANGAPADVLLFQGTESGMRFVTTFSAQSRTTAGLRLVEYFVAKSRTGNTQAFYFNEGPLADDLTLSQYLFREITTREDGTPVALFFDFVPRSNSTVLFDDLAAARLGFYQRQSPRPGEPPAVPQSSGQKRERLPIGVEIRWRWNESGILSGKETSVVIPVIGAGAQ
jgi:prepilin-type N-terminal cleavage/methylation domain-containing protein